MKKSKFLKNIGPGPLIAAAFIGPGTVTLCVLAGAEFGYSLLWALIFAIFSAIILQEMSARLGLIARRGLSEIIRTEIHNPIFRGAIIVLILSAIVVGNAAYEAGNISGGMLGLEAIFGTLSVAVGGVSLNVYSLLLGAVAFALLITGSYKVIEKALIAMVVIMSLSFVVTVLIIKPDVTGIFRGIFAFQLPSQSLLTVVGLIGTTVVPYNLFLHTSLAKEKWTTASDLRFARKDTIIAIGIGGIVSMCIVILAAATTGSSAVNGVVDLASTLEPLFGRFALYFLGIGLFSAGITSAITAPLAVSYVACGCFGWKADLKSLRFKVIWVFILIAGVIFSTLGVRPIVVIKFAQIANGLLLPVVAVFLFWVMNRTAVLGEYKNSFKQNAVAFIIILVTIFLGLKTLLSVLQ